MLYIGTVQFRTAPPSLSAVYLASCLVLCCSAMLVQQLQGSWQLLRTFQYQVQGHTGESKINKLKMQQPGVNINLQPGLQGCACRMSGSENRKLVLHFFHIVACPYLPLNCSSAGGASVSAVESCSVQCEECRVECEVSRNMREHRQAEHGEF